MQGNILSGSHASNIPSDVTLVCAFHVQVNKSSYYPRKGTVIVY